MTIAKLVNSIGLLCDIVGAILIWRFGLPEFINRSGHSVWLTEQADEKLQALARKYDRLSLVGLLLLIVGFTSQLISNFISR